MSKPKLYFYDTGLVAYLTKWSSPETLEAGAINGAILENFTVAEIVRPISTQAKNRICITTGTMTPRKSISFSRPTVSFTRWRSKDLESRNAADPSVQAAGQRLRSRGKGAILCMKNELTAIDSENFIVPIWAI